MDLSFESFGYEYPSHHYPEPACLGFRGYELPTHGTVFPYDHPSTACLEFEGFSPPPDYGLPPTDYRLPPTGHRFPPRDYHFSPTMTRSDYWNYSSPVPLHHPDPTKISLNRQMFPRFLQRHSSIEETPVPVSLRRLHWYRDNMHAGTRGRRRHIVKRLDKAWSRTIPNKILILPPSREISETFPPYPLKELQTARNKLIDELYSSQGGMRLFKIC
ncbi:uncharacterized protein LOC121371386 isoform X3 [Gigantopelta aegis]|uniref:uncharacterized protein LOC121371386 isoform X3 n=1 Tax=Gigantopelta aegis TaxID=1735272 RepID=UPI001B88DBD9|nr:uncharacterized protein LOC121371386 isoform X3 [Gigantopelta aegis]